MLQRRALPSNNEPYTYQGLNHFSVMPIMLQHHNSHSYQSLLYVINKIVFATMVLISTFDQQQIPSQYNHSVVLFTLNPNFTFDINFTISHYSLRNIIPYRAMSSLSFPFSSPYVTHMSPMFVRMSPTQNQENNIFCILNLNIIGKSVIDNQQLGSTVEYHLMCISLKIIFIHCTRILRILVGKVSLFFIKIYTVFLHQKT